MANMAFLKQLLQRGTSSTRIYAQGTDAGEMLVAAGMAEYEEITRDGHGYHCTATTATASAVAIPTRDCGIALWNGAEDGGKSIIIDAVYALNAVGHAVLGQAGLMCIVGQTDVASVTSALIVRKNNGNGPATDSVAIVAAGGATAIDAVSGVAIGWIPVGAMARLTVISLPGVVLWAPIDGRIIVPPARVFGVNVISSNVENTFNCGIMWHEKQLTLG